MFSVMYGSWYQYTLDFEKAVLAEPDRFHLMYFEDLKEVGKLLFLLKEHTVCVFFPNIIHVLLTKVSSYLYIVVY